MIIIIIIITSIILIICSIITTIIIINNIIIIIIVIIIIIIIVIIIIIIIINITINLPIFRESIEYRVQYTVVREVAIGCINTTVIITNEIAATRRLYIMLYLNYFHC